MTDKELKKLSRLELLELLLTESRENERLKEELEKVKQENTVEKSARQLNETSDKLESALQKMSSMISELGEVREKECVIVKQAVVSQPVSTVEQAFDDLSSVEHKPSAYSEHHEDFDIYKNLLVFYISNPQSLDILPNELRQSVINRIEEIKSK